MINEMPMNRLIWNEAPLNIRNASVVVNQRLSNSLQKISFTLENKVNHWSLEDKWNVH